MYDQIKNIPDANWIWIWPNYTTFDDNKHQYIFKSSRDQINWQLFTVDAITGNIISSPSFPVLSDTLDNVIELQYDNSSNTLYGLHWDNSENTEYLVTIDQATGIHTKINKDGLSGVKWVMTGNTTFDKTNHRFVFKGGDDNGNWYLYTVDATTGNIISNPICPVPSGNLNNNVFGLQYDNSLNKYYGLIQPDYISGETFLVSVDITTGLPTQIGLVPGLGGITKATYDEINHRYSAVGHDNSGIWHLYSIDVNTANIISSPSFPELSSTTNNVIEFEYDNASGILYALRWDPNATDPTTGITNNRSGNPFFNLYPNPFSQSSKIVLSKPYREITIFIYNSLGQVIRKQTSYNSSTVDIQRNDLSSGTYFISVICERQNIGTQKIIIE